MATFYASGECKCSLLNDNILLKNNKGAHIAQMEINGINKIEIIEEDFAPSYSNTMHTKVIKGYFNLEKKCHNIITTIRL